MNRTWKLALEPTVEFGKEGTKEVALSCARLLITSHRLHIAFVVVDCIALYV